MSLTTLLILGLAVYAIVYLLFFSDDKHRSYSSSHRICPQCSAQYSVHVANEAAKNAAAQ